MYTVLNEMAWKTDCLWYSLIFSLCMIDCVPEFITEFLFYIFTD